MPFSAAHDGISEAPWPGQGGGDGGAGDGGEEYERADRLGGGGVAWRLRLR